MAGTKRDPNTLSNYHVFRTRHIHAAFSIDFSKSVLKGGVRLSLEAVGKEDDDIVLDTSHLDLSNVTVNGSPAEWKVEPRSEPLGSALKIKVGKGVDLGQVLDVSVCGKGHDNLRNPVVMVGARSTWLRRRTAPLCNGSRQSRRRTRSTRICVSC